MNIIKKIKKWFEDPFKDFPKKRKLNDKEAEFMADYFHNKDECPDPDGYVGTYILPKEVMRVYTKKYGKEREWEDE